MNNFEFEKYCTDTLGLMPLYFRKRKDGSYYDDLIDTAHKCWNEACRRVTETQSEDVARSNHG